MRIVKYENTDMKVLEDAGTLETYLDDLVNYSEITFKDKLKPV